VRREKKFKNVRENPQNVLGLLFINSSQESYLSDVGLNPPHQRQHNEGVGVCNEGKLKATI